MPPAGKTHPNAPIHPCVKQPPELESTRPRRNDLAALLPFGALTVHAGGAPDDTGLGS